ncbi:5-oxoprolinase subunit PxpA [Parasphingorhabdus sp. JC815]|uniref:5-oxoprolinase subunit PxpA n=1 Tax=Parasphingorhabdus sp. JC815 TaxID=3232140 RepID=UPI003458E9B8
MTDMIDLNADLGEDESAEGIARDIAIMDIVSSCNIACGAHAGSPETMRAMLIAANEKGISAGAHPSYPDRANFGRKTMSMDKSSLTRSLLEQLESIDSIAKDVGTVLTHLKPHGALYNDAQDNESLADILVSLAQSKKLALVCMADSIIQQKAREKGVRFVSEAFIDRRYTKYSRLVPRTVDGAVIHDNEMRVKQGLALAQGKPITTIENQFRIIEAETLCLHSDSDDALTTAKEIRYALEQAGIAIAAPVAAL